jgi:capsular polysaccharide biosynthesis protein
MDLRTNYFLPAIVLLSSPLALASVIWDWGSPLRWILVFWFLLICPGMAFAYLLPGKDQITRFFLMIVLSFALDAAVAQSALYLGMWSPKLILWILMGFCWLGIFLMFAINIFRRLPTSTLTNNPQKADVVGIQFYLRIIQRGWWLILISVVAAVNFSLINSYYFATPMYETIARFIVSPNPQYIAPTDTANNQKVPDKRSTISTYGDILNSYQIRSSTLELLLQNPDEFKEYITSVILLPDQDIIQFSVKGPNPETTVLLANSIGQHAIDSIKTFYLAYNIDFLNRALVPSEPYEPRPAQDAGLALLMGLVFGVGLVLFRDQIFVTWSLTKK